MIDCGQIQTSHSTALGLIGSKFHNLVIKHDYIPNEGTMEGEEGGLKEGGKRVITLVGGALYRRGYPVLSSFIQFD